MFVGIAFTVVYETLDFLMFLRAAAGRDAALSHNLDEGSPHISFLYACSCCVSAGGIAGFEGERISTPLAVA